LLITRWNARENTYEVVCGNEPRHKHFQKSLGWTAAYKAGYQLPPEIEGQIEKLLRKGALMKEGLPPERTTALVPTKDVGTGEDLPARMVWELFKLGDALGLKPELGHIIFYFSRPYVTEAGQLYYARKQDPGFRLRTRAAYKGELDDMGVPDWQVAWHAEVLNREGNVISEGWGFASKDPNRQVQAGVSEKWSTPQRRAEKRAELQALRKAFPLGLEVLETEDLKSE